MIGLAAEIDDRHRPGRHRPARLRLLLGRDRLPARHHPPGRPATLGPHRMTAATAALDPGPLITGPGSGATADDTTARADFGRWEREFAADDGCSHPIQLRGRIDVIDLATGELRPSTTRRRAGGVLPPVRQPPRDRLPVLLGGLQARRPPARPRRAGRRQGHPRDDHRAPVRVRHPHRPLLRPGPRPPDARQDRAALPPPPRRQGPALPARPRHLLPDPPRRGRSPARPADVPATATTTKPPCCSTPTPADLWRRFTTYLPRHLARLAGLTQKTLRALVRIRYVKVAEYQARGVVHFHAVIRLDAPGEDYQPPPARYHRRPAVRRHRPGRRRRPPSPSSTDGPGRSALGFGAQTDTRTIRHGDDLPGTGQRAERPGGRQLHRQVRHQDPRRPRPARPAAPLATPTSTALRCSGPLPADDHHRLGARRHRPARIPAVHGRTCSATAATSSPNPAATPSPSASSAAPAPNTAAPQRHPDGERDPWGRPLDDTVVLVLPDLDLRRHRPPNRRDAELALASAARAREHHGQAARCHLTADQGEAIDP